MTLSTLQDVPIKIGDFWVPEDFVVADVTETDDAQIILGRSLLATTGCTVDVKGGRITFKVGVLCYILLYGQQNYFPQFCPI